MAKLSAMIHDEEDPFGPGTDLIVSLVAFLLFILAMAGLFYQQQEARSRVILEADKRLKSELLQMKADVSDLQAHNAKLQDQVVQLTKENNDLVAATQQHLQTGFPPYIPIEGAAGYDFEPGQAALKPDLKNYIHNTVVPQIDYDVDQYKVDTIVVIGHTDGNRVSSQRSNVDDYAKYVADMQVPPTNLVPGSNVDLGMMRALAVIAELRDIQRKENKLRGINANTGFRAYSAGSFLTKDGAWASASTADDIHRRRIEIRFLRHNQGG